VLHNKLSIYKGERNTACTLGEWREGGGGIHNKLSIYEGEKNTACTLGEWREGGRRGD
jgi:hypothetical protein